MFDVGASELLLIVIVAIVVIGPKDMPLALRTAGRWIGKIRRISGHFRTGVEAMIRAPFHCDYGYNISIGKGSYVNFNCVFLDLGPIRLGQRCLIGPGVQLLTAVHPMNAAERATGKEKGAGIEIGDDCWLGGGVIVCPGVKIGCRCVIGAGSVVTHDIPDDSVAAGNPARVIRTATDE